VRMLTLLAVLVAASCPLMAEIDLSDPAEPWLQTHVGVSQEVPAPFEPVTVEGSRLSVWGRTYDLAGPFPAQMTSAGEPLFAAPMRLVLSAGGEEHVLSAGDVTRSLPRRPPARSPSRPPAGSSTMASCR